MVTFMTNQMTIQDKEFAFRFVRDRFRTVINVIGDSYGAAIVHHLSRHELSRGSGCEVEEGHEKKEEGCENENDQLLNGENIQSSYYLYILYFITNFR